MTDLILCAAVVNKNHEDNLEQVIKKLDKHKFINKYILFDGPPEHNDRYTKYKKYFKDNYSDFKVIENTDCIYYKKLLQKFIKNNFDVISKNCLIIQDDVLLDDFDLEKVLETKAVFSECKILYFREHRLRLNNWFNIIDDSGVLIKIHAPDDSYKKVYLISREYLQELLLKEKVNYYEELLRDKTWETITQEEQLDYWRKWGTYEHKTIRYKHLATKR